MKTFVAGTLRPLFKARKYRERGLTFYRKVDRNFGLVELQKDKYSTADKVGFTLNVGVFSRRLHDALGQLWWVPRVKDIPEETACQLRRRIGLLTPSRADTWWSVEASTSLDRLGATLGGVIDDYASPFLDACMTDEGLRDHWLAGNTAHGAEELALAVLLRDLGPREELGPHIDRMRSTMRPDGTLLREALDKLAAIAS